ncbi:MAG: nuclear transport factor 2 family protein, partial [Planctomycetota bacterium]
MNYALAITAAFLLAFPAFADPEKDVDALLSRMHEASKNADVTYFDLFAEDAVFFGTDLWERWTKEEFAALYKPYMESGRGWEFKMRDRRTAVQPCGTIALFDETLFSESYGPCRGSGAARLDDGEWRIVRYHLDITIPNEVVERVSSVIENFHSKRMTILYGQLNPDDVSLLPESLQRAYKPDVAVLRHASADELDVRHDMVHWYRMHTSWDARSDHALRVLYD